VHVARQERLGLLAQGDVLLGCGHCSPLVQLTPSVEDEHAFADLASIEQLAGPLSLVQPQFIDEQRPQ
jgi:hypothetical protein